MTLQMTSRSWSCISRSNCTQKALAIPHYSAALRNGRFQSSRAGVHDQIWRHRRKLNVRPYTPSCYVSSQGHIADTSKKGSETYVVCNHNLSTLDPAAQVDISSLKPCGKCHILGDGLTPRLSRDESRGHQGHGYYHSASVIDFPFSDSTPRTLSTDDSDSNDKISPYSGREPAINTLLRRSTQKTLASQFYLNSYRSALFTAPNDANWIVVRAFHSSSRCLEESKSKVEDTVKALKEEAKAKQQPSQALTSETPKAVAPKKSLWQRFVAELKHYYHGFKLLFIDVRLCSRYLLNILRGQSLSRRERRQLVRTTADLFRLVPFLVFIVVPFMEFLLPVALKLFPGMLPSTFNEEKKEQEKLRIKLKSKLEVAKFLQDTIEEMALLRKGADESRVQDFKSFMESVRSAGEGTSNEEIIKYSKLFKDEITLDSLGHEQLTALCKLLELQPIGTNAFLRFQLRMKLRQLEADDRMIDKEGIDNLAVWELQEACRARGMRALGVATSRLKTQLQQWLDLHLREKVPTSLLLLSRALYLSPNVPAEEQLKATISALPETTTEEATVAVSEVAGERIDNKTKLEIIRQEEQAIQEEREESKKEKAAEEKKKEVAAKLEAAKAEKLEATKPSEETLVETEETKVQPEQIAKELGVKPEEILVDKATVLEVEKAEPVPEVKEKVVEEEDQSISKEELEEVEEVLEQVAEERMSMKLEQDELEALKEDVSEYKENLEDLKLVVVQSGGSPADVSESKAAQRLSKQVYRMVDQLEGLTNHLHADKDVLTEEIEVGEVRIKRSKELQEDDSRRQEVLDQISENKASLVSINELLLSMRRLQKISDDTKFQRIMEVLDEDQDGIIDIEDALKVIELLGRENVKVSASKMSEILELLRKESVVEEDIKKEKEASKAVQESEAASTKIDGPDPKPEEILKDSLDSSTKNDKDNTK